MANQCHSGKAGTIKRLQCSSTPLFQVTAVKLFVKVCIAGAKILSVETEAADLIKADLPKADLVVWSRRRQCRTLWLALSSQSQSRPNGPMPVQAISFMTRHEGLRNRT
jgi:hypothetical protein